MLLASPESCFHQHQDEVLVSHGWLDNPTFSGMRAQLMADFDDIQVLDLHGSSKTPAARHLKWHRPKSDLV